MTTHYEMYANVTRSAVHTEIVYAGRSIMDYLPGSADVGVGGYLVASGGQLLVRSASHDKCIASEMQMAVGANVTIDKLLGYEPVLFSIDPTATITQYVGTYFPNVSAVANLDRVSVIRCYQSDHHGAAMLVNGSVYAEYGHLLGGLGQSLSPAPSPGYRGGTYYPGYHCRGRSIATLPADTLMFTPFMSAGWEAPNRIGLEVITPASAGKKMLLGIFIGAGGQPTTKMVASIALAIDTVGYKEDSIVVAGLPAGLYHLGVLAEEQCQVAFAQCDALTEVYGSSSVDISDANVSNVPYESRLYGQGMPVDVTLTGLAATANLVPNIMLRQV